ncbi:MAG TPA: PAS domain S-box protein, partial [Dehalococcoidia bacterium]|nr:PAS domain S-box protein [Dehalococcoidia bacterium]
MNENAFQPNSPPALAEFEALPAVLDQLADSFMLTDREGRILHVNPQFLRNTGYTLDEVIGKTPRILKSGAHPPEIYRELWDNILQGKAFR